MYYEERIVFFHTNNTFLACLYICWLDAKENKVKFNHSIYLLLCW